MIQRIREALEPLLGKQERVLLAIEGSCTAGKTTLAGALAEQYDCNVFHMDDFFLRPEQRTEDRYAQAGGNVDYERFRSEVLEPLLAGGEFTYRPFDCRTFSLSEPVQVLPKKLNIIEGSYSMHPFFGNVYDLTVFLTVSPELQRSRVAQRPAHLHKQFHEKWIPMENRYFREFDVKNRCHLVF